MTQQKHLIVLGGDARHIQVMKTMAAKGVTITAVGFTKNDITIENVQHRSLSYTNFETADAILLPVAGVDNDGKIALHNHTETITLTAEILANTPESCLIFSGAANQTLRQIVGEADRTLIPIFERDDVAIANAIPTAEATLQIAMENTNITMHDANVTITGFGRIGTIMAHLFHQVGANVTVVARKDADLARIKSLTYEAKSTSQLTQALTESDIIINTVPALILDKTALEYIPSDSLIIDVASKPGGIDFDAANLLDIQTIHALGLPGKVAPVTAGNIIAEVIMKKI